MLPDGIGHITSKAMTNLNARLTVLRAAVPNHTALLHFSGQGDRPDVHTARRTASSSLSNTGIGKTLGQSWELAALWCVEAQRSIGRSSRRSSGRGWGCYWRPAVDLGDDYVTRCLVHSHQRAPLVGTLARILKNTSSFCSFAP
jgi:hypothetical protein